MPEDWSQLEVEAIIADYFAMWKKELHGIDYNKAEHNRQLQKIIPNRSRGSIEKKHQNISAILWHLGYPYIDGYKPLPNYQTLLRKAVEERLRGAVELNRQVGEAVQAHVEGIPRVRDFDSIQVPAPKRQDVEQLLREEVRQRTEFSRRNYLEIEAKNHSLGRAGEEFILQFERERLCRAGKDNLASKIEHVAQTEGDHLGFDILSFETNGREKLIEVKTTRYGAMSRFFASANEVEISDRKGDKYHLYRLFNFSKQPKFFDLPGSLRNTCQLQPATFLAVPN